MSSIRDRIPALRQAVAALGGDVHPGRLGGDGFALGDAEIDRTLGGGLARAALHEIFAQTSADAPSLRGVAAGFALRAAGIGRRPVAWIGHDMMAAEAGTLDAAGLAQFAIDPASVLFIQARAPAAVLRSAFEAAQCMALGAVVAECWGASKVLDLTATRRLTLAAQRCGVTIVLARAGACPSPSAAETRWGVRAGPSRPLAAGSPGYPAFDLSLLRHRRGIDGKTWRVEWSCDERIFRQAALSGGHLHASDDRPAAPQAFGRVLRLAG